VRHSRKATRTGKPQPSIIGGEGKGARKDFLQEYGDATLWEGADGTMVRRSATHIVKSDTPMDIGLGALHSGQPVENGASTDMKSSQFPCTIILIFS
jgi:hypothetical protein